MKIKFEEGDIITIDKDEYDYREYTKAFHRKRLVNNESIFIHLIYKDHKFYLSPRDFIRALNIVEGFSLTSPAFGDLIFVKEDKGFIVCKKDDELFYFNGDGQVCWWDSSENVWHYDDESECMIYPKYYISWCINNVMKIKDHEKIFD